MALIVYENGAHLECEPFLPDQGVWKPAEDGHIWDAGLWKEFYSGKQLITETLSGTSWTCPPGVTSIEELVGRGGAGLPARTTWGSPSSYELTVVGLGSSLSTPVSQTQLATQEYLKFPSSHSESGQNVTFTHRAYAGVLQTSTSTVLVRVRSGASRSQTGNGWGRFSSEPEVADRYYRYNVGNLETGTPRAATRGASTHGFGETFQGGLGGSASQRTVSDIPVMPGQTYQLSIPSSGLLRITYYG